MTDADKSKQIWQALSDQMANEIKGVERGKMMSADALTYGGKVFAFYSTKGGGIGLGCRLGRNYPFDDLKLSNWRHLAPFKTKPAMKDWLLAGFEDAHRWRELAEISLQLAQNNNRK